LLENINIDGKAGLICKLQIQVHRYEQNLYLGKVYRWVLLNAVIRVTGVLISP
jgi:hypothetical protein